MEGSATWKIVQLGDVVADVTVGYVGPMVSRYVDEGVPFLRSYNVEPYRLNLGEITHIDIEFHAKLSKSALKPGDVVVVRTGRPGACAVIPANLPDANCSDLVVIRPGPQVDPRFLMYWINAMGSGHVAAHLVGAVQQHFNIGSARQMPILLPHISEQRAIAAVLGSLDDKIDLNRRMNETLEATARAIFKAWFVDFEALPVEAERREPVAMVADASVPFGRQPGGPALPRGWSSSSLDQIAEFRNGLALQRFPAVDGEPGLPVIKIAQMRTGRPSADEFAARSLDPAYVVDDGDVLFSWSGSLEVCLWTGGRGALNQHLFRVSSTHTPKWYYLLWTKHHLPNFREIAANKATTMGHIQRHHLTEAQVAIPPQRVMDAMGRVLGPMVEEQVRLGVETRTLQQVRDALLPRLLSGEVRVRDLPT